MIALGILYFIIGVLSGFSMQVVGKVYGWTDDFAILLFPILAFIAWPVVIPIMIGSIVSVSADSWAIAVADKIKNKR